MPLIQYPSHHTDWSSHNRGHQDPRSVLGAAVALRGGADEGMMPGIFHAKSNHGYWNALSFCLKESALLRLSLFFVASYLVLTSCSESLVASCVTFVVCLVRMLFTLSCLIASSGFEYVLCFETQRRQWLQQMRQRRARGNRMMKATGR